MNLPFTEADPPRRSKTRRTRSDAVGRSEAGFTLVELMVVMPFLLIVTALVSTTMLTAYGAEARVQATSQSSSQVTLAFIALDSEIRYASDINQPGKDSSTPPNYYVEFDSNWNQNSQGEPLCTQLEYNNSLGQLQQRTWYTGATIPTVWKTLASALQTSVSTNPFTLIDVESPWQLTLTFTSVAVSGASKGNAGSSFTITALDTTASSASQSVCGGTP
jgi:type II secretory pathway pseudopilin PulG